MRADSLGDDHQLHTHLHNKRLLVDHALDNQDLKNDK